MVSSIKALTDLAVASYEATLNNPHGTGSRMVFTGDSVLDGLTERPAVATRADIDQALESLRDEPALAPFRENEGLLVLSNGGGSRETLHSIINSLLLCAARQIYMLGSEFNETSFVGLVLENYEELKRASRGEQVRAYKFIGFSGVNLPENTNVETPWGSIRSAPINPGVYAMLGHSLPVTTAILSKSQLQSVTMSSDTHPPDISVAEDQFRHSQRISQLLPLAFALVTVESNLCAPLPTFELTLLPFRSSVGWSTMPWFFPVNRALVEPTRDQLIEVEVWSRRLDRHFAENLEVTGRRIVSAIAQRADATDSLVDAVTAWESIVGTRNETSFRVTAALAKLLEKDPQKRSAFRKELGDIYNYRSRAVHGDLLDPAIVSDRSTRAIEIGLKALSAIYSRSGDWLTATSSERADRLILEE